MWKFVRGKTQHSSVERQKIQRELFAFRKNVQHGFPNKPTCLAWDPELRIAAIGTASGVIKVFGKCGVEFNGYHPKPDVFILKIVFVPSQGRLITLCEANSLRLWEVSDYAIEQIKDIMMEGKLKKVSTLCVENSKNNLLVGTEGGNIYIVNLDTFTTSDSNIIYQDIAMSNVPEGYKINPGAVETIIEQPQNNDNILIGYSRGLIVLWNKRTRTALQTYVNNQQLESLDWDMDGSKFITTHNDGSYITWSAEGNEPLGEPITLYGPYPCKAIVKLLWCRSYSQPNDRIIIFSGGMPRATCGDRYTVSVLQGIDKKHVVFDFTSKVIDFFAVTSNENKAVEALIVLLEEEIVAIDLKSDDWRMIFLPYFCSLHTSAVSVLSFSSEVSQEVWDTIINAGKKQHRDIYSDEEWPINGGTLKKSISEEEEPKDIILTGHEDGSVRFWRGGTTVLSLMYTFKTNIFLSTEDDKFDDGGVNNDVDEDDEEWPPFKKIGCFDPYSDDPRFSIKKLYFCGCTGIFCVAGAAGQVFICGLSNTSGISKEIKVSTINIIPSETVTAFWKGPQRLSIKGISPEDGISISMNLAEGCQPFSILQLFPPAPVTALAVQSAWELVSVGTAHGVALYDYKLESLVLHKCFLHSNDYAMLGEPPISRTKSFKKSLRESFRRIRKGGRASTRNVDKRSGTKSPVSPVSPVSPTSSTTSKRLQHENPSLSSPHTPSSTETKPIERAIEARSTDDALGSIVRCLTFAPTYILSTQHVTPSLWVGTNNGTVYIFTISVPGGSNRRNEKVSGQLGKEIQLKHRAPVVNVAIIDGSNKIVSEQPEVEKRLSNKSIDTSYPHYVIIGSEEQFKIFTLPSLKPMCKLKLTAMEGARIRRMGLGVFVSENYKETALMTLTNLGECIVFSLPDLRRQLTAVVIRREDINGISSFVFTKYAEGMFMYSNSEIQRVSLSTDRVIMPSCSLTIINRRPLPKPAVSSFLDIHLKLHSMITNGIPEEDEDEDDESEKAPQSDKRDSGKLGNTDDENQAIYNHDVSAITVDSVKDHISNMTTNDQSPGSASSSNFVARLDKKEGADVLVNANVSVDSVNDTSNSSISTNESALANISATETTIQSRVEVLDAPLATPEDIYLDS